MHAHLRRAAFTLVELLLVVAIIGVVTAIVMPDFVRSLKGNRLRTATRSVVATGRYARSMAVLKQREMALVFNLERGLMSIHPVKTSYLDLGNEEEAGMTPDLGENAESGDSGSDLLVDAETDSPLAGLDGEELVRSLDGVRIASVEIEDGDDFSEGRAVVRYRSNGTCMPYRLRIEDHDGTGVEIRVDALSTASTELSR